MIRNTGSTIAGGAVGGAASTSVHVINISVFAGLPSFEMMLNTIILAAIGATVGYFIKLAWDKLLKRKSNE